MLDVNGPAIESPAEDSPEMDFEQVWKLLPRLENEVVTTAARRKRYQYRIVRVCEKVSSDKRWNLRRSPARSNASSW